MGIDSNLIVGTLGTNNCSCVICTDLIETPVMLKLGVICHKIANFRLVIEIINQPHKSAIIISVNAAWKERWPPDFPGQP